MLRSVDAEARREARRCFGRSDRRAQRHPWLLRSIRPTRATTSLAASVDPTDARCAKARLAPSVRLATPVQAENKPAASAELDRTVRPVFLLANQHRRWELNDL